MWHTPTELISSVIISLGEEVANNPQMGWVRGDIEDSVELLSQINKLRIEKEKVDKEYLELKRKYDELTIQRDDIAFGRDKYTIRGTKKGYREMGYGNKYYSEDKNVLLTWDEIFSAIGPYLTAPITFSRFINDLVDSINSAYDEDITLINDDCAQTIKIQLCALGLIKCYQEKFAGGDFEEAIKITEKGSQYLIELKEIKR